MQHLHTGKRRIWCYPSRPSKQWTSTLLLATIKCAGMPCKESGLMVLVVSPSFPNSHYIQLILIATYNSIQLRYIISSLYDCHFWLENTKFADMIGACNTCCHLSTLGHLSPPQPLIFSRQMYIVEGIYHIAIVKIYISVW